MRSSIVEAHVVIFDLFPFLRGHLEGVWTIDVETLRFGQFFSSFDEPVCLVLPLEDYAAQDHG